MGIWIFTILWILFKIIFILSDLKEIAMKVILLE